MKYVLLTILLSLGLTNDIARINKHKAEAQKNYLSGDYANAIQHYQTLVDTFAIKDPSLLMNYANAAYFLIRGEEGEMKGVDGTTPSSTDLTEEQIRKYLTTALDRYTELSKQEDKFLGSLALNQLGVIAYDGADGQSKMQALQQAKSLFKSALKADPLNERARYNYELVSKKLDEEQQQQDQNQDQDQQDQEQEQDQEQDQQEQQDQQDQQQQDQQQEQQGGEDQPQEDQQGDSPEDSEQQEGEPQDSEQQNPQQGDKEDQQEAQEPSEMQPVKESEISEEKAKMILEAMKNAEIQYIQQNKRKAAKRPESGKPDW